MLGIDPGTLATGYGVVEKGAGGSLVHVCDGVIRMGRGLTLAERLRRISDALALVFKRFSPDCVAVESVFFSANARSALMLGHARGVALLSAANHGVPVHEYSPKTIKLAVVGYGGATKEQVQKMVAALLKREAAASRDAADALAASICHIHHNPERLAGPGQKAQSVKRKTRTAR